jgi:glycosyltransferase involved in cell wall biosynthesis
MNIASVSVIIAVKNGQDTLGKCLDSVLNCVYGNFEVICIDDGSSDRTPEILRSYSGRVKVITNISSTGPAFARNKAASAASGEYLAFTDADCIVDKNWLEELVRCFSGPGIVSAGGVQGVPDDESRFARKVSLFMDSIGFITGYLRGGTNCVKSVAHNPSCNSIYRKEIFLNAGGFPKGLWPGEDVELDYRLKKAGYRIMFNPKAIVYHYRPGNIGKFSNMMSRYGWAQAILVRKYGFFRFVQFVPIFNLFLIASLAMVFFYNWQAGMQLLFLIVFLAWVYFLGAAKNLPDSFIFMRLFGALIINWDSGFLKGILTSRKKLPEELVR